MQVDFGPGVCCTDFSSQVNPQYLEGFCGTYGDKSCHFGQRKFGLTFQECGSPTDFGGASCRTCVVINCILSVQVL